MKKMLCLIGACICSLVVLAQTELAKIYTDKDGYLAGENLWVKVTLDDSLYTENRLSEVAYVEINDTKQMHAQGKVLLQDGSGWACIRLPHTMHSGVYQLVAYTRYMRNLDSAAFPRKHIAVLNARMMNVEDQLVVNDSTITIPEWTKVESKGLMTDKSQYGLRSRVRVSWPATYADAKELVLSVYRKDCKVSLPQEKQEPVSLRKVESRWQPEMEGHWVEGKAEGTCTSAQFSCVGKEVRVVDGLSDGHGHFTFFTRDIEGQQDIVFLAKNESGETARIVPVSPFVELLPKELPVLQGWFDRKAMEDRNVSLQLQQSLPVVRVVKKMDEFLYGEQPTFSYNLDEYTRFNTIRETIIEFISGSTVGTRDGKEVVRMMLEQSQTFGSLPVLLLIDGVPFDEHSVVLDYNAHLVHYIHQYRGNYAFGKDVYGGILSIITRQGTLPSVRITDNMQMVSYEFPQNRPSFAMPTYADEKVRQSRMPDYRHTLYWNPCVQGRTEAEFYTSDLKGIYSVILQGVDAQGNDFLISTEMEVKE